jgi:CBS domain-containing protein
MATRARDLMQTGVLTVAPETPLADVQRLFVEEGIGGAPVVDETSQVVGVITASDVLRAVHEERDTAPSEAHYFREDLEFALPGGGPNLEDLQDRLSELRAEDAMTPGILSVGPEATAAEIASELRQHRVHRVLVIDGGALAGIVSTFDLVGLVEKSDL